MTALTATSTTRDITVARVLRSRAVAVVRLPDSGKVLSVCEALVSGGIDIIEMTMTTPGALQSIARVRESLGDVLVIGAGSVLNADDASAAIASGAHFVVSPVFSTDVVRVALAADVPVMPGAFTPTEILHAHNAGADVVKVFPSDALGPAFLRGVLGPMPFLRLMPTGGVTPDNVTTWWRAGAVAVGLGSALVDPALVAKGQFAEIERRARTVVAARTAFDETLVSP